MNHKRYDSAAFSQFRKEGISEKGGDIQRQILEAAGNLDSADFVAWLDGKIAFYGDGAVPVVGDNDPALLDAPRLSVGEFITPPQNTALLWFATWWDLPLSDAVRPSFWGYVTRQMIAAGKLRPYDLALSHNRKAQDEFEGKAEINEALNASGDERPKKMDACVRNFFRRLSSLPEERGARSVYLNCPFSRVWWQCHVARSVAPDEWEESVLPLLTVPTVWEQLADKMASRLTVLGDENIRNGIIQFLMSDDSRGDFRKRVPLNSLLVRVGVMTSWCALGFFPPKDVQARVREISQSLQP